MDDKHPNHDPAEAHLEGLSEVQHDQPHHATTQHDKPAKPPAPPIHPPTELHRGGPLPNQKK